MDTPEPGRVTVTVQLTPERLERARKRVEWGDVPSVDAWVEAALLKYEGGFGWEDESVLLALIEEMERENPSTEEHRAWARRVVHGL